MKIFTKEPKTKTLPSIKRALYFLHDWGAAIPLNWKEHSHLRYTLKEHPERYDYNFSGSVSIDYKIPSYTIRNMVDHIMHDENLETLVFGIGAGAWLARLVQLNYYKSTQEKDPESPEANKIVWAMGLNPMIEPHVKLRGETMKMHKNIVTGKEFPWNKYDCQEMQIAHESVDFQDNSTEYMAVYTRIFTELEMGYHKPFSNVVAVAAENKKTTTLDLLKTTMGYFEDYRDSVFSDYLNTGQIKA